MYLIEYSTNGWAYYYVPVRCETFSEALDVYRTHYLSELRREAKGASRVMFPRLLGENYDDEGTGLTEDEIDELSGVDAELAKEPIT